MRSENVFYPDETTAPVTRPIVKWAGGKKQLLHHILPKVPDRYNQYIEPFFGGGALFFALQPKAAVIADANPELINLYRVVAHQVEDLLEILKNFKTDKASFYQVREQEAEDLSTVERAARMLFLNRTCFNGLYRVNRRGRFNVPYGDNKNPRVYQPQELRAASRLLQQHTILCADYKEILAKYARPGDFIYLDPPYLPVSQYSDFKRYTKEQFYEKDHITLAQEVKRLHQLGCSVLLSNSNHPLVHELYRDFQVEVYQTRRNISKNTKNRKGEDLVVYIPPRRSLLSTAAAKPQPYRRGSGRRGSQNTKRVNKPGIVVEPTKKHDLVEQVQQFPPTRFMGSKKNILANIWQVVSQFDCPAVIDLFSGSGVVSYMFKAQGKQVFANDFMAMNAAVSKALVENNHDTLSAQDVEMLLERTVETDRFVSTRFQGLYFNDEENHLIDCIRANIKKLNNEYKHALAVSALVRAAVKKRPRGVFTYTGYRYDDGRRDLQISLEKQFIAAVEILNKAVFDNGQENFSRQGDAMDWQEQAALVYMDPPYYSPYSDNDYVRRYHFVEGLACDWKDLEIQEHTVTKKFKSYPSPFSSRTGAIDAFDRLFHHFRESILVVSYSSNSLPGQDEMLSLLAKYKKKVEVVAVDYRYSFANQAHKVKNNNNRVQEYIFVGYS